MTHGDNKMGTTEKVTQLSHGLKQLAQEFETAIIGVAQLNREAVKDGVPEIHHLQNSGALEQDAEVVILLHRDKEDPAQVDGKALTLLIRKNRKGANYIDIRLPADLARMYISNKSDF
jgi:replicative DNA helicase